MLSTNAALKATLTETPEGQDNIITISHSGETYGQSDVKYVFDYYGPTGRYSKEGLIRHVNQKDFQKIISENLDFKIQKNDFGELVLHYIKNDE
jgi:hypothetical protein